jgi:hypothetical protein
MGVPYPFTLDSRTIVVCRHRFDVDPDPYPNLCFNADLDLDRHQNDADPHADHTQRFSHVGK